MLQIVTMIAVCPARRAHRNYQTDVISILFQSHGCKIVTLSHFLLLAINQKHGYKGRPCKS